MAAGNRKAESYLPYVRQNEGYNSDYPIVTTGGWSVPSGSDLLINTTSDNKTVKVNSRNYAQTSGTGTAIQTKPQQTVTTTGSINGAEFSPRVATGINAATIVGVLSTPLFKGTGSTISGNFEGFQAALTDSQTSGNTVSGDIVAFRGYLNMASQTVTGNVLAIKIDDAGSTQGWTAFARLPSGGQMANTTGTTATQAGYIKVIIGSTTKYIPLYNSQS
jgi:hypothetical protein